MTSTLILVLSLQMYKVFIAASCVEMNRKSCVCKTTDYIKIDFTFKSYYS